MYKEEARKNRNYELKSALVFALIGLGGCALGRSWWYLAVSVIPVLLCLAFALAWHNEMVASDE